MDAMGQACLKQKKISTCQKGKCQTGVFQIRCESFGEMSQCVMMYCIFVFVVVLLFLILDIYLLVSLFIDGAGELKIALPIGSCFPNENLTEVVYFGRMLTGATA